MPSLILHIGTAKTGTTSIQRFLSENRQALASRGVMVPSFLGVGPNHRWLPLLAQDEQTLDGFARRQGLHTAPERLRQRRAAKRLELQEAVASAADAHWIISSEQLHSRLELVDLLRLQRLLGPLFEEIHVLVYLRHPLATALSSWSTRARSGRVTATLPPPESFAGLCNHAAMLRRWQQVFGRRSMTVRLFHPAELQGGSLIEDFCACAGIGASRGLREPGPANRSLSYQAIKLLWHLLQQFRRGDRAGETRAATAPPWRWRELVRFVERSLPGFPPYLPTARERDAFVAHYADSERWVCQEFIPERERLWDRHNSAVRADDDPRFQSTLGAEEAALVAMLAELWLGGAGSDRPRES